MKKSATPPVGKTPKGVEELNPSVGDSRAKDHAAPKTSGIRMRGAGAAKRGVMSRGPMG